MGARADRGVGMLQGSWGLARALRRPDRLYGDRVPTLDDSGILGAFVLRARPTAESRAAFSRLRAPGVGASPQGSDPDASAMPSGSFRFECATGHGTPARLFACRTKPNPIAVPCVASWRRIRLRY